MPFRGNPAAVCVLAVDVGASLTDQWMANVAAEMNLAETAFLWPEEDDAWRLRWFTPTVEVDLCGHATLAAAHVLWENGHLKRSLPARFQTRSGLLTCWLRGQWIEMDFPATPAESVETPAGLAEAMGAEIVATAKSKFDLLVELSDEAAVRSLRPDFQLLAQYPVRGIIATAPSEGDHDFVSRFFAPNCGINEDPVCGSAHCTLAPFWAGRLQRQEMIGYQASARGGIVRVKLQDDRVVISGQAVTVLRGELFA